MINTQRKIITPVKTEPGVKPSIRLSIRYNCGCGFISVSPKEAAEHVNGTGHVVSMAGLIKPAAGWARPLKPEVVSA